MKINKQKLGKKAYKQGKFAELIAQIYLACKGYTTIDKRCRTPLGEVDLICKKSGQLIIIEVKSAANILNSPDSPIRPQQLKKLIKATDYLYQKYSHKFPNGCRLDAVLVDTARWKIKHHRNITQ